MADVAQETRNTAGVLLTSGIRILVSRGHKLRKRSGMELELEWDNNKIEWDTYFISSFHIIHCF